MQRALCAVAALALVILLLHAGGVGLAGDYVDPISKVTAQDEALYANSSIHMARQGNWLTPMFMGRLALYKPPLLMWMSGLSARLFGISRLSLRLPGALLCSLALGLIFLWAAELRSWQAGACAALLVASNHLWQVLGATAMTDGLLVAFYTAVMYCLFADPWLESRPALWGFAGAVAASILTKSVAGVLPLGALGLYWLGALPKQRPTFARLVTAGALSLALAAPWFVYQMLVHGRWFWAEHIGVEILGFGAGAPPQTSSESHAAFYFLRLVALDPVLLAFTLLAVPGLFRDLRKRSAPAVLLVCWLIIPLAAALGWQYRNASYLLPMIPAMAVMAAVYGPNAYGRRAAWMLVFAAAMFAVKAAFPGATWGLSFRPGSVQAAAPVVSDYCRQGRGNELIIVGMDDDLYASTLPLSKLRYSLIMASTSAGRYGMPFDYMGIVMTASHFNDPGRWEPLFRSHLREWGLDSPEPLATLVTAASPEQLGEMIRANPASDFLLPEKYRPALQGSSHLQVDVPGHVLLLSRNEVPRTAPPAWSCGL